MMAAPTHGPSYKEATRVRILDEAARAFCEAGTPAVGVAGLMKHARLTHSAFYAHFHRRDDLVLHALRRMFEDSRGMLARLTHADAAEGLRGLIDPSFFDALRRTRDCGRPLPGLSAETRRLPPAGRAPRPGLPKPLQTSGFRRRASFGSWQGRRRASSASLTRRSVGACDWETGEDGCNPDSRPAVMAAGARITGSFNGGVG